MESKKEILLQQLLACIRYKHYHLKVERNTLDNMVVSPAWLEEDEINDNMRYEISIEDNGYFFINGTGYECSHKCISEVMEVIQGLYDFED